MDLWTLVINYFIKYKILIFLVDYFIEYCKDHHCKIDDNTFEKISKRTEIIKRKDQKNPIEMYVYETSHGTLEYNSDNDDKIKEGYYLSR